MKTRTTPAGNEASRSLITLAPAAVAPTLGLALAIGFALLPAAHAADFTWDAGGSGNWTTATNWDLDSDDPDDAGDTATIDEAGTYTVTLDADRTIGSLTLDANGATLNASGNTLTIHDTAAFNNGTILGTFRFEESSIDVDLTRADVSIGGTTTYEFRRGAAGDVAYTFDAGDLTSHETLDILNVDSVGGRGNLTVSAAAGYTNSGTVNVRTSGFDYSHFGTTSESNVTYNLGSGGIINQGSFSLISTAVNASSFNARASFDGDLTNAAGATFLSSMNATGAKLDLAANQFTRIGGTYVNSGDWTVTGEAGLNIAGDGTTFTQSAAGASLSASRLVIGGSIIGGGDATVNTVTLTAGSIEGGFVFRRADVTLGAGVTLVGPTTFAFAGDDWSGPDVGKPINTFTGDIASNMTILLDDVALSEGAELETPGSLSNAGTITLNSDGGADFNQGWARMGITGGGTLTSTGVINMTVDNSNGFTSLVILEGNITNDTGGVINVSITGTGGGSDRAILGQTDTSGAYINRGTIAVNAGELDVNGVSLTNESGGVIQGVGTLDVLGVAGGLVNAGTIAPGSSVGSLTIDGDVVFDTGGILAVEAMLTADQLIINGDLDLSAAGDLLAVTTGVDVLENTPYEIITYSGSLSGVFDILTLNGSVSDNIIVDYSTPGSVFLTVVPEPTSLALLAMGVLGLTPARRRRLSHRLPRTTS